MAITNLTVSNFKSFKQLDLDLGRFNVVIGANASGKSNFVEIFRFLKTLERESLDDAISLHGGRESIPNKRLGLSEPLRMRATSDRQMPWGGGWADGKVYETTYDFSLRLGGSQNEASIAGDHFSQKLRTKINGEDAEMTFDVFISDDELGFKIGPDDVADRLEKKEDVTLRTVKREFKNLGTIATEMLRSKGKVLLIQHPALFRLVGPFESLFAGVGVYDIEPHEVKRPQEKAGRASLERNGENLALVLKQILTDPEKTRKFHNLLQYMLPFAMEVGVEQYLGTSLLLKLREEYYDDSLLANLLSDGTVDVVALITALFFEDKDVVIIEEPERNIHPHLISGLMRLMEDASRNKQIIITTHSPEVVRYAGVENLLLLSRDKEGFSVMSRPAEKEAVRAFLKNDLGLDELFVQNVLAVQ
ncbi:MAG: AAA family ATPase [Sedimentisphaerales bacterium]|nr:AAA family ATPase [Sedimentisphaerales bacterium]